MSAYMQAEKLIGFDERLVLAVLRHGIRSCLREMPTPKWLDRLGIAGLVSIGIGGRFGSNQMVGLIGICNSASMSQKSATCVPSTP